MAEPGPAERQLDVEPAPGIGASRVSGPVLVALPAPDSRVPLWKSLGDYLLGSVLPVCALPLLALTALAVRVGSPGPVLFRQERLTQGERRFALLKFRTLAVGTHHEDEGGEIRTGRLTSSYTFMAPLRFHLYKLARLRGEALSRPLGIDEAMLQIAYR